MDPTAIDDETRWKEIPNTPDDTPRTPPHDQAAEAGLIGAALLYADPAILDVDPDDLYHPPHVTVANTIAELAATGQPIDTVTVANHLGHDGLRRIGGAATLLALQQAAPIRGATTTYADIIRRHATARRLIGPLADAHDAAWAGDPTRALDHLDKLAAHTSAAPVGSWQPIDLGPILAGDITEPPPAYLHRTDGQALLYPGRVHAFNAESESGKSWLALAACHERLTLGEHALYIDFEDNPTAIVDRLRNLGADDTTTADRFHYIRPDDPLDITARAQLERTLEHTQPTLAILDGVTEAMVTNGWSILDNDDVARFLNHLARPIARTGAAVVLIDHVPKQRENRGKGGIGGQHKRAGIDVSYLLEVTAPFGRGLTGTARLTVDKDRPGWIRPASHEGRTVGTMTLASTPDGTVELTISPAGHTAWDGPTECMNAVYGLLASLDGDEVNQSGLESRMKILGHPFRRQTIREAAERLALDGRISVRTGPRNARIYRLDPHHQAAHEHLPDPDEKF